MKLITTVEKNWGIGRKGIIPWHIPEQVEYFKDTVYGNYCVFGHNTSKNLPIMRGIGRFCLTSKLPSGIITKVGNNTMTPITAKELRSFHMLSGLTGIEIFICGGLQTFEHALETKLVKECTVIRLDLETSCDTFFPLKMLEDSYSCEGVVDEGTDFVVETWRRNE